MARGPAEARVRTHPLVEEAGHGRLETTELQEARRLDVRSEPELGLNALRTLA